MSDIVEKCKVALLALSDWAVTYAPDKCDPDTVAEAKGRILEHGTLAYIANATDQLHAAILALSEAEKREAKAKRIAVNAEAYGYGHGVEAAATLLDKVADKQKSAWDAHIASGSGNAATSHEAVYRSLASQVRALQSEDSEREARAGWAFAEGDIVRKKSGSWWEGRVVGTYSTEQTPRGYAIQLDKPFGPVQIYPESALEPAFTPMSEAELVDALSALQSEDR